MPSLFVLVMVSRFRICKPAAALWLAKLSRLRRQGTTRAERIFIRMARERPYEDRPRGVKLIVTLCVLSFALLPLDYLWCNLAGDDVVQMFFLHFGMPFTVKSALIATMNGVGAFCLLRMKPNGEIFFGLALLLSVLLSVASFPLPYSLLEYVENDWSHYYAWPVSPLISVAFMGYARRLMAGLSAKARSAPAEF